MKNAKTFISGVLAGALAMSAPALAYGVKQLIEAELNTVNITVDGVKVDGENFLSNTFYTLKNGEIIPVK